jgi:hypothetical protein
MGDKFIKSAYSWKRIFNGIFYFKVKSIGSTVSTFRIITSTH